VRVLEETYLSRVLGHMNLLVLSAQQAEKATVHTILNIGVLAGVSKLPWYLALWHLLLDRRTIFVIYLPCSSLTPVEDLIKAIYLFLSFPE